MAKKVMMKNETNGLLKKGFYGFSWTYLFFGWLVPVIRGEIGIGALHLLMAIVSFGISQLIFCFIYNRQYTHRLIEAGFRFADRPEINSAAALAINADLNLVAIAKPSVA
jgi:hypothetical protein